jgi:hypothetical protein
MQQFDATALIDREQLDSDDSPTAGSAVEIHLDVPDDVPRDAFDAVTLVYDD